MKAVRDVSVGDCVQGAGFWPRDDSATRRACAAVAWFSSPTARRAFLELRPEATKTRLKRTQDWLRRHALQLMVAIAVLLGGYLAVSGLIRLS